MIAYYGNRVGARPGKLSLSIIIKTLASDKLRDKTYPAKGSS